MEGAPHTPCTDGNRDRREKGRGGPQDSATWKPDGLIQRSQQECQRHTLENQTQNPESQEITPSGRPSHGGLSQFLHEPEPHHEKQEGIDGQGVLRELGRAGVQDKKHPQHAAAHEGMQGIPEHRAFPEPSRQGRQEHQGPRSQTRRQMGQIVPDGFLIDEKRIMGKAGV